MESESKLKQSIPDNAQKVFEGVIFDVYQWEQEMFDGSKEVFEKLKRLDTANILAFTEEGKIIVLEQEQPSKGKFFSLPGGRVETNENPQEGACRELLEETGYEADQIELWHSSQILSKIDWTIYNFVARGCKKVADQKLDAGERIKIHLVDLEEFINMILKEKIKSSEYIMRFFKDGVIAIDRKETLKRVKKYFSN